MILTLKLFINEFSSNKFFHDCAPENARQRQVLCKICLKAIIANFSSNIWFTINGMTKGQLNNTFLCCKKSKQVFEKHVKHTDRTERLILLYFAENYNYVVQDEVQTYYWKKQECTLHPVVLYHKNDYNAFPFVFCQMTWITIQVLYMSCKEELVIILKVNFPVSAKLSTLAMVELDNKKIQGFHQSMSPQN